MVSLLFDSGLRLSEVPSIQSKDIDWTNNTLRVVVKGNGQGRAAFTSDTAMLLKQHLSNNGHNPTLLGMKPKGIQDMLGRLSALLLR